MACNGRYVNTCYLIRLLIAVGMLALHTDSVYLVLKVMIFLKLYNIPEQT